MMMMMMMISACYLFGMFYVISIKTHKKHPVFCPHKQLWAVYCEYGILKKLNWVIMGIVYTYYWNI